MDDKPKDLGVNVAEDVKTDEQFGQMKESLMRNIAGTLKITHESQVESTARAAWSLAKDTQRAVVIVVKAV